MMHDDSDIGDAANNRATLGVAMFETGEFLSGSYSFFVVAFRRNRASLYVVIGSWAAPWWVTLQRILVMWV